MLQRQSTVQNTTGVSMDQTVMQGNKRKTTETVDLTMGEGSSKCRHLNNSQNAELVNDNEYDIAASVDADQVNVEEISPASSCWEASEELDALLGIMFKPLPRFDRRAIVREFPRPVSPNLDNHLPPMITGAKANDTPLKDIQDKVLDTLGPLCTLYENIALMHESLSDGKITLDSTTISATLNCVKKVILLIGDTSAQLSTKQCEQVLAKLNP